MTTGFLLLLIMTLAMAGVHGFLLEKKLISLRRQSSDLQSLEAMHKASSLLSTRRYPTTWRLFDAANNDGDEDEDDDDDEIQQTAYGNRSLAWTKNYKRLIPYEFARAQAMSLGLSSKEEWQTHAHTGPYMISRPDEMYQEEWVSWEEFLGAMRPYEETKYLVQSILKLKSMDEYRSFVQMDPKRAEGLRIPAKPEIVYKDSGWQGSEIFFGTRKSSS